MRRKAMGLIKGPQNKKHKKIGRGQTPPLTRNLIFFLIHLSNFSTYFPIFFLDSFQHG